MPSGDVKRDLGLGTRADGFSRDLFWRVIQKQQDSDQRAPPDLDYGSREPSVPRNRPCVGAPRSL